MKYISLLAIPSLAVLGACSAPADGDIPDGDPADAPVEEAANVSYGENFGDDSITMNSLAYDAADDTLVINNLPFDGPNGTYVNAGTLDDGGGASPFERYESVQEPGLEEWQYYAVFMRSASGNSQAAAVGTDKYIGPGWGGITAQRLNSTTTLPSNGEYVYIGEYAGIRHDGKWSGSIQYVTADVTLAVDIKDFDVIGAVEGTIDNYYGYDSAGGSATALPDYISLATAVIDFSGARVETSEAVRVVNDEIVANGSWTGVFAGASAGEFAGIVLVSKGEEFRETGAFIAVK